ncbi:MAG: hypothetical protein QXQ76_03270, partial [Candidatus Bathyarchaeia archaeon]
MIIKFPIRGKSAASGYEIPLIAIQDKSHARNRIKDKMIAKHFYENNPHYKALKPYIGHKRNAIAIGG